MQEITTGDFLVGVECPHCGRGADIPAVIEQVLKVKGREGSLTVALSAKAIPHDCGQEQLPFELLEAAAALGSTLHEGESMTMSTVDRDTGEVREATLHGRGVRL
jgi:hypothetical protein